MFRTTLTTAVLAGTAVVALATPAVAGGTGDFYKTGSCRPSGASSAVLGKVTNYDYGTGQRVHTSMTGGYIDGHLNKPEVVYVNGVARPAAEAYTYIEDEHKAVTVLFVWGWLTVDEECASYITSG